MENLHHQVAFPEIQTVRVKTVFTSDTDTDPLDEIWTWYTGIQRIIGKKNL